MKVCAWFLLACGLLPTLAFTQVYRPEVPIFKVAHEGEPVPGVPGATYETFSLPQIDAAGNVMFIARMNGTGIDDANDCAIFFGQPDALMIVAREGEPAPDMAAGVVYADLAYSAAVSETGWIAFTAFVAGPGITEEENDAVVYCGPPGDFQKALQTGDPAPGFWPGVEVFISDYEPLGATLTDNGTLFIGGGVRGLDLPVDGTRAYWFGERDNLQLMVWHEMPVVECPACQPGVIIDWEDTIRFNDAGQMSFRGAMSGPGISIMNDGARWIGAGGAWDMMHREGDPMPEFGPYAYIRYAAGASTAFNGHGDKVNRIQLGGLGISTDSDWLLLAGEPEPMEVVVREGDFCPEAGDGVYVRFIGNVFINDMHHLLYDLTYDGPSIDDTNKYGVYYGPYANPKLILREGDAAPYFPNGTILETVLGLTSLGVMNDVGDCAGMTAIDVHPIGDESTLSLWLWHGLAQQYIPLLEPDTSLCGRTVTTDAYGYFGDFWTLTGGSDGRPQSFNDRRQLTVWLDFTDGSFGLYRIDSPFLGDADGDGLVTQSEFSTFIDCMTGPGAEHQPGCEPLDFDLDGDIDMADFRVLQLLMGEAD